MHQKSLGESRFASFADRDWFDARPVTTGNPPVSRCNYPGMTFQVAPTPEDATSYQVQAMDRYGLKVGMMDGSVRVVSPRVSEEVFWGAVTPAAGESVSLD